MSNNRHDQPDQQTPADEATPLPDPDRAARFRAAGEALRRAVRACGISVRYAVAGPGEWSDVFSVLKNSAWFKENYVPAEELARVKHQRDELAAFIDTSRPDPEHPTNIDAVLADRDARTKAEALDTETLARAMAKAYEPDLDWDNDSEHDLLDRAELTDSAARIIAALAAPNATLTPALAAVSATGKPLTPCGMLACTGCSVCGCAPLGIPPLSERNAT